MAAAVAGAPFGTPVSFPVYHPGAAVAYYAHASMAAAVLLQSSRTQTTSVPARGFRNCEAVAGAREI